MNNPAGQTDEWGRVIFSAEDTIELLFQGHNINKLNIETSSEIESYNESCIESDKLEYIINPPQKPSQSAGVDQAARLSTWKIPQEYLQLDIRKKLLDLCQEKRELDRVNQEMDIFQERQLIPVLQLMCYLVDKWRKNKVVWGVGRGSSVASYCLFLIGVHRIDSLYYDLNINEFLK